MLIQYAVLFLTLCFIKIRGKYQYSPRLTIPYQYAKKYLSN